MNKILYFLICKYFSVIKIQHLIFENKLYLNISGIVFFGLQTKAELSCNETTVVALNLTNSYDLEYDPDNTTSINVSCAGDTKFLNPDEEGKGYFELTCNEFTGDFELPDSWPECITKCPIPVPTAESGFQTPEGNVLFPDRKIILMIKYKIWRRNNCQTLRFSIRKEGKLGINPYLE